MMPTLNPAVSSSSSSLSRPAVVYRPQQRSQPPAQRHKQGVAQQQQPASTGPHPFVIGAGIGAVLGGGLGLLNTKGTRYVGQQGDVSMAIVHDSSAKGQFLREEFQNKAQGTLISSNKHTNAEGRLVAYQKQQVVGGKLQSRLQYGVGANGVALLQMAGADGTRMHVELDGLKVLKCDVHSPKQQGALESFISKAKMSAGGLLAAMEIPMGVAPNYHEVLQAQVAKGALKVDGTYKVKAMALSALAVGVMAGIAVLVADAINRKVKGQ